METGTDDRSRRRRSRLAGVRHRNNPTYLHGRPGNKNRTGSQETDPLAPEHSRAPGLVDVLDSPCRPAHPFGSEVAGTTTRASASRAGAERKATGFGALSMGAPSGAVARDPSEQLLLRQELENGGGARFRVLQLEQMRRLRNEVVVELNERAKIPA